MREPSCLSCGAIVHRTHRCPGAQPETPISDTERAEIIASIRADLAEWRYGLDAASRRERRIAGQLPHPDDDDNPAAVLPDLFT
ncbi:MAG: hypothetical protein ACRCY8_02975 [Dermatophilaceae bacterium]